MAEPEGGAVPKRQSLVSCQWGEGGVQRWTPYVNAPWRAARDLEDRFRQGVPQDERAQVFRTSSEPMGARGGGPSASQRRRPLVCCGG